MWRANKLPFYCELVYLKDQSCHRFYTFKAVPVLNNIAEKSIFSFYH